MAEKAKENKIILEREYVVPLRRGTMKTVYYKRASKAIKVLKQFIAKHMKVEDRDLRKVKLDRYVNEEIWMRGIRKPLNKLKIKAKKYENGLVSVELVDVPKIVQFRMDKEKKRRETVAVEEKKPEVKAEEKTEEEKKVVEEKEKSTVESGLKQAESVHKEMKHTKQSSKEKPKVHRMALQK
jgi:large subunit ribosomal protein L31e